jgi:beta-fructofuranosidase
MLDYRPDEMSFWDLWFAVDGETVHMFYQQGLAPGSKRDPNHANYIGHAVSSDLLDWTEHPLSVGPGEAGGLEDMWPWTGCAVVNNGTCFMYYTMRSTRENGKLERTGLATSTDFENWERCPQNPVLECDPRWYINGADLDTFKRIDHRDFLVVEDPERGVWFGFYATRIPAEEQAETSVIGCAVSKDLLNWEPMPPAFVPAKYGTIEVPDIFPLNGKWYMTCYTGTGHGNRGIFSDHNVIRGSIYAVSDKPEGPYHKIEGDNVYGAAAPLLNSTRTVEFKGKRYAFSTVDVPGHGGTLTHPALVVAQPDGKLRLAYAPITASLRQKTLISPDNTPSIKSLPFPIAQWARFPAGIWHLEDGVYIGESRTGWQTADLGVGSKNIEIESNITIESGAAAGLVYRPNTDDPGTDSDIAIILDIETQKVIVAKTPVFHEQYTRNHALKPQQSYHLRVNIRYPIVDVYIDDILVIQCAVQNTAITNPAVGLFVDRARVQITNLSAYQLA